MVLFVCNDLMFVSRVQQTARSAGVTLVTRPSIAAALSWLETEGNQLGGVVVDLKGVADTATLKQLTSALQSEGEAISGSLLAFGPHVKTELLQAASDAGFQNVWTQGQFDRGMQGWFSQLNQR